MNYCLIPLRQSFLRASKLSTTNSLENWSVLAINNKGLAIYLNITLGYKFSGTFLNAIVGKKNTFDDLKTIDPDLYKSLVYIKDMEEDASELGLTFMYTDNIRKKNIQLLPNGHLIHVTK